MKSSHDELSVAILHWRGVFTATLHSNGRGTDPAENQSRDSHIASILARWLLPSNNL
jgi:hypothetical protein